MTETETNNKTHLIFLIDTMLHEANGEFVRLQEIHQAAFMQGFLIDPEQTKVYEYQRKSNGVIMNNAKKAINDALAEYGMSLLERSSSTDKRETEISYPLEVFERNIDVIKNFKKKAKRMLAKQIAEFIGLSTGFLPQSMIAEAVVKQSKAKEQRVIVDFGGNVMLKNFELLTNLFVAARDRKAVSFDYEPFGEQSYNVVMHPYLLKEYNSRWYVIGGVKRDDRKLDCCALDRIVGAVAILDETFDEPSENLIKKFENVVGPTVFADRQVEKITIRTNSQKIHNLITTKPIHRSQRVVKPFFGGEGGIIELEVIRNIELRAVLLSFGSGITVLAPESLKSEMKTELQRMEDSYHLLE